MSNLINKTRLQKFAEGFWAKIKDRYDNAFKDATITEKTNREKKITFTKVNNTTQDVSLEAYARLSDKNDFEKDVTSNIGMTDSTLKFGNINGNHNQNRTSGHRGITSKLFVDGYIDHITVLADETQTVGDNTTWTVWAVKKEANRTADRVHKRYSRTANIKSITIKGVAYNAVDLPINESFSEEVYFIVRCEGRPYKVINLSPENQSDDVVNVSVAPGDTGSIISWERVQNNIAVMFLVGRESIKSLSEKLDKVNADGGLYVKQDEVSTTSVANKVVRLDGQGKLNKDMLPSIAINEYFEITDFTNQALQGKRYENGDVAVVTGTGANSGKRYLCINKGTSNATTEFIELNSKDGSVLSVNGRTGAVELNLEATDDKFKLKISGTGGAEVVKELDIISEADINSIINGLN